MTCSKDKTTIEVKWTFDGIHEPECQECAYFKHNHCDNRRSDHCGHMLMPFHFACDKFTEK